MKFLEFSLKHLGVYGYLTRKFQSNYYFNSSDFSFPSYEGFDAPHHEIHNTLVLTWTPLHEIETISSLHIIFSKIILN